MADVRDDARAGPDGADDDRTTKEVAALAAELGARAGEGDRPAGRVPLAAGRPPGVTRLSYNILLLLFAVAAVTALVALSYSSSFRPAAATTADRSSEAPHPQRPGFLDTPPRGPVSDSTHRRSGRDTGWAAESLSIVRQEDLSAHGADSGGARVIERRRFGSTSVGEGTTRAREDIAFEKALVAPALIRSLQRSRGADTSLGYAQGSIANDSGVLPGAPAREGPEHDDIGFERLPSTRMELGTTGQRATAAGWDVRERRRETESFLDTQRRKGDGRMAVQWNEASNSVLTEGTIIPAELLTDVNSDLPGDIIAEVTRDVFDSPTQRIVLIPRGSRLAGRYDDAVALGQHRLLVVWTRLMLPDGRDVGLPGLQAADERGASGIAGSVDSHIGQQFGDALLLSLLGAGVELSQPGGGTSVFGVPSVGQVAGSALGQQLSEIALELVRRHADVPPTISLPLGSKFNVYLNRDLVLPPRGQGGEPEA